MRTIHQFKPGDIFNDRYKLLNLVGVGGFAEVWKAFDTFTQQEIAIKIYAHLDDEGRRQLTEEYARVQALSHPNILKAEHFDICGHMPYLTMRYCAGGSLESQIGELSGTDMAWVVRDIMSALNYLHTNGIVHQDIKPANILIDTAGNRPRYVLCDFGISSRTRNSMSRSMRKDTPNAIYMTTFYAPPEKFSTRKAERQPFPEGDLFSFGVTLLELTGTLVNVDKSLGAELMNNSQIQVNYGVLPSEPLRVMVRKMIAFERSERGTAQLFYDWAVNVLEKMPHHEQQKVKRIDLLNHKQETRLLEVENSRRKSILYNGENGNSENKPPQPPIPPVSDAEDDLILIDDDDNIFDNSKNQGIRKPKKIDLESHDNGSITPYYDNHSTTGSRTSGLRPEPVPVGNNGGRKSWPIIIIVCILVVFLAAAFAVYRIAGNDNAASMTQEELYIPDADINFVEAQVSRLNNRVTNFSETRFYTQTDFDQQHSSISGEISLTINRCDNILAHNGLEPFQRRQIEEDKYKLSELKEAMDSYVYIYGQSQTTK